MPTAPNPISPDLHRHRVFAEELRRCDALAQSLSVDQVAEACVSLVYLVVGLDHAHRLVQVLPQIRTGEELASITPLPLFPSFLWK